MIIRGKEIKPESITMWLNIISFFVGVIFYADVIFKFSHSHNEVAQTTSKAKDSLLVIDTKLTEQLNEIKIVEDSILIKLRETQNKLAIGEQKETTERKQIYSTIQNDWDKLPLQARTEYANALLLKLRKHQNN